MTDSDQPPTPDRLTDLLDDSEHEEVVAKLERIGGADADTRKRALRAVRTDAEERPSAFDGLAAPLATFLVDDDRAVRLTSAKLFVTLAASDSSVVLPVIDPLAERLTDDEEFYYVRARCAEALGYVALEFPEEVSDPEILADLRIGLSFDEPEVRTKLAKALAYVALGDSSRLRHQVPSLAEHLDAELELVRYQLCTALVAVGCENPERMSEAESDLRERLDDESPYVRGRAAEGLALGIRSEASIDPIPDLGRVDSGDDDPPAFLTDRVRFLRESLSDDAESVEALTGLGTVESIRDGTDDVVEAITSPDGAECQHCGLDLPESGPPMCPRCGAPH
ncbi:HEAT repeat domain-containing protein [Natrinema altunense]|uniref:HEAT repeat protein n=1 Tax=Natrinema altunense (strain JCM 12890 / CGMCC 1.3731 / AJ2) TaxID=1227494 RepID=L9ZTY8_NATA2|nr:HEAT repeat domain-containing protein [Natrinema altunense]ELY89007.1 HEAT repeat protein [Natrinema altunense JCM 12890]